MGNRRSRTVHHHHTRVVRDDSAQRNHAYRMQQLRDQRAAQASREDAARRDAAQRMQQINNQQAAAKLQANRQHQYRMEQLAKQKQLEMQQEAERQRAAKRVFEGKMKAMKLKEKNDAITRVKSDIASYQNKNNQIQKKLSNELEPQLADAQKNINISETKIKSMVETGTKQIKELDAEIKKQEEKYKAADGKIRDAIKCTDVDESNIPQFLDLVNDGLLFATMKGQQEQDRMLAKLKVFADLIQRTCAAKLPITTYFKDVGLERLTPILIAEENGYKYMNDLRVADKEEWEELLGLTCEGLKSTETLKKNQKLKVKERNLLKRICMKPDKTWLPDQKDQEEIVRKSLMTAAPKLSNFFGTLHSAVQEISQLLEYNAKLTAAQQKAIESTGPVICEYKEDEKEEKDAIANKNISTIQFKQDDINTTNQECKALGAVVLQKLHIADALAGDFIVDEKEIESMDANIVAQLAPKEKELQEKQDQLHEIGVELELINDEIEIVEEESDPEDPDEDDSDNENENNLKQLKQKRKKLRLKHKKLEAVVSRVDTQINAIESRRGEIISIEDVLSEAFTVATNVEDSCLQIIKSQCVTRQSILLARELLKYKPAAPCKEAKPLWATITTGIGDIFENALQLSKISATYFAFFIKFQHGFDHFVTANKMKKNVSLLIASQYLIEDVSAIQAFQAEIDDKVAALRDSAIKTIRDCVSNTAGAQEFETAIAQRQAAESALRVAMQKYNEFKFEFDDEFQERFADQQQWIAKKRIVEYQMQEFQKNVSMNQQWINQLAAQVKSLENLMVT